tara:strand:- start:405 stop:929 length:525 start_codon:yes stop_codon:yes gene_type:complete
MAGSLIKIKEEIVTSAVASVSITGMDSTYDVYMVRVKDLKPATNTVYPYMRFTESGTVNTSSSYDYADKNIKAGFSYSNMASANQAQFYILSEQLGTGTQELLNGTFFIFNASNATERTYFTQETTAIDHNSNHLGSQGGGVFKQNSEVDGVNFFMSSGNIDTGSTFILYGLNK